MHLFAKIFLFFAIWNILFVILIYRFLKWFMAYLITSYLIITIIFSVFVFVYLWYYRFVTAFSSHFPFLSSIPEPCSNGTLCFVKNAFGPNSDSVSYKKKKKKQDSNFEILNFTAKTYFLLCQRIVLKRIEVDIGWPNQGWGGHRVTKLKLGWASDGWPNQKIKDEEKETVSKL